MRVIYVFMISLVCFFVFNACNEKTDERVLQQLSRWDEMMDSVPQQISDSLRMVNPVNMGRAEKAYWGLLKVVSDDKTYVNFTSDSMINAVCDYYQYHDAGNRNYIRALAYQGIVRTRMGVKDSTVYEPLREADRLLGMKTDVDTPLSYLINYFLGNIHYNNRNYASAEEYFARTLKYARRENDSVHLFDTYLALYWNEMEQRNFEKGREYLDTISSFYNQLPGKDYFILNAQSIYYDVIGEPIKALEREKNILVLYKTQDERTELSRAYFNISNIYIGLEQLDSAMLYAQMSIDMIEDTSFIQNYLYYQNVAIIAEKQGNFALSNKYLRNAFELHNESIRDRLDMQIAELEKKYDLSEAENMALRTRQQNMRIIIGALILFILLIFILMSLWKVRKTAKLKLIQAEYRAEQQGLQAKILREEAGKRKWLLQLYGHISERLAFLQEEFEVLNQRYISSHPKIYKEMEKILKNTDTDLRHITKNIAIDDESFYAYTGLKDMDGFLNTTERMLLMLLACDADNRQLATFMNTSMDSIRVRKSQLKKKMQEKNMDTGLFEE